MLHVGVFGELYDGLASVVSMPIPLTDVSADLELGD